MKVSYHLAGLPVVVQTDEVKTLDTQEHKLLRLVQRCAYCGLKLLDYKFAGDARQARSLHAGVTVEVREEADKEVEVDPKVGLAFLQQEARCQP